MSARDERARVYRQQLLAAEGSSPKRIERRKADLRAVLAAALAAGDDDYRLLAEAELQLMEANDPRDATTLPLFQEAALVAERRHGHADPWMLRRWGQALERSGDDLGAKVKHEAAFAIDARDPHVLGGLAGWLNDHGDSAMAEDLIVAAFDIAPSDHWLHIVAARRVFSPAGDTDNVEFGRLRAASLRHPRELRRFFLFRAHEAGLDPAAEWKALVAQLPTEVDRQAILGEHGWAVLAPLSGVHEYLSSNPRTAEQHEPGPRPALWYELEGEEADAYCARMQLQRQSVVCLWSALMAYYDAWEAQSPRFEEHRARSREADQLPTDRPLESVGPFEIGQILLRMMAGAVAELRGPARWLILTDEAEAALAHVAETLEAAVVSLKEARVKVEAVRAQREDGPDKDG